MKFFIADLHLKHEAVRIGPRLKHFPTQRDWDQAMLDNILSRVTKHDTLFLLGDTVMDDRKELARFRSKLKGDIWCIRGNHDPSHKGCSSIFGFNRVRETYETKLAGEHKCFLHHYAQAYWPSSHRGAFHLYGHCHMQREETLDIAFPGRRSMDVCPENVYRIFGHWGPVSEHEILDHLGGRPGHDPVEFYINYQGKYEK